MAGAFVYDLERARELVVEQGRVGSTRSLRLSEALGRVAARPCRAVCEVPGYDQAVRDGFAIITGTGRQNDDWAAYRLAGEVAAGSEPPSAIEPGDSYRIMTGAMIPPGSDRVVMQEDCQVRSGTVRIPLNCFRQRQRYIQCRGSDIGRGVVVVAAGTRLEPGHIAVLAATGNHSVEVYRRPRIGFVCSGSELVAGEQPISAGHKFSANKYLLDALIRQAGAIPVDHGIVIDSEQEVRASLGRMAAADNEVMISTGGVGPGKYDLFEEALVRAGGRLHYRSLAVRPGKATLYGIIGNTPYFGLPGPPFAVTVLFHEIIAPLIRKMQGMAVYGNQEMVARLAHQVDAGGGGEALRIAEGIAYAADGELWVRASRRHEPGTCFIHIDPASGPFTEGTRVTISVPATSHVPVASGATAGGDLHSGEPVCPR